MDGSLGSQNISYCKPHIFCASHLDVKHYLARAAEQHIHQMSREEPIVSIEVLFSRVNAIINHPKMMTP